MKIISFEGPDGVGKSTQVKLLRQKLESEGKKVYSEHFPRYDDPIGELIGRCLNGLIKKEINFETLQMLYAIDQTDFRHKLAELDEEGFDYVLLDRYDLSTIVYYCSKMNDTKYISLVSSWQNRIIKPDITIVLLSENTIHDRCNYKKLDEFEKDRDLMKAVSRMYVEVPTLLKKYRPISFLSADVGIDNLSKNVLRILYQNDLI